MIQRFSLIITGALLIVLIYGCGDKKGAFRGYVSSADGMISELNTIINRHNAIQGRITGGEGQSEELGKLKADLKKFREEKIASLKVNDPELKQIHEHMINAAREFEEALGAYLESPEKKEVYDGLIEKSNRELSTWYDSLKKSGEKNNIAIVPKKAQLKEGSSPSP